MSRTLIVTGGAGFIGSNFVHFWRRTHPQDRLVVLDALTYAGNVTNLESIRDAQNFRFYECRIEDAAAVHSIFKVEQPSHVLNFAAESHNDRSSLDPTGLIATNVAGVSVLLEACRLHGCERFLQVSTDEVYGEIDSGLFRETDPLEPRTLYSAAKAGAELQVRAHRIAYNSPTLVTRGSNTFGPFQYPEKILPFFITRALAGKKLPLYGDGSQVRDWIFVSDHCSGIANVLLDGVLGEAYNVGGANERTNLEVTRRVLGILGCDESLIKFISDPRGASHDKRYALDCSKSQGIGWHPEHPFEEALEETVQWYLHNESWWRPITGSSGYRSFVERYYGPSLGQDL